MIRTTTHQRLLFTVAAVICSAFASSSVATAQPASQAAARTDPTSASSHCGVDAVQLLKTPAGWKIVSIAEWSERRASRQQLTIRSGGIAATRACARAVSA